nr:MAG TPA: hypothetical protein [Caudoviricetes sp.]
MSSVSVSVCTCKSRCVLYKYNKHKKAPRKGELGAV